MYLDLIETLKNDKNFRLNYHHLTYFILKRALNLRITMIGRVKSYIYSTPIFISKLMLGFIHYLTIFKPTISIECVRNNKSVTRVHNI